MTRNLAIGADHGGFPLKQELTLWLRAQGHQVRDLGAETLDAADDYPDFALAVAQAVASGEAARGIIICGSGVGACIAANKVPGVRAANCHDISSARNSREHNYANVLTLGSGFIGGALAIQIVSTWLDTEWGAERHGRRVEKISAIEDQYSKGAPQGRAR
jgi:ribose 5-phosphate isomerase B